MQNPKKIDSAADRNLSDEVYRLALKRIEGLMGCTPDSPEERELIHWCEIADARRGAFPAT
jgi:hypothetical protein